MNAQRFEHWLCKNLPVFKCMAAERKVVLIIDNAAYHGRTENKIPKKNSSRKQDMINFLESYDIVVPYCSTKNQLEEIIQGFVQ